MGNLLEPDELDWDDDYINGRWNFLEKDSSELARHALIANYCRKLVPVGSILDIGCGTGTLCDFLDSDQKSKYLGIDVSSVAVKRAKEKLGLNFLCTDALSFDPSMKFDAIVFNEVLYYTDYEVVLKKYLKAIEQGGIAIFSIFRLQDRFNAIWHTISEMCYVVEAIELAITNSKGTVIWDIKVATVIDVDEEKREN